jgi:hypothetical protein
MRAKTITALFYDNRDNLSDKWEQYLAVYDAELRPWRNKRVSLLEIGVQNGGSMQLWSQYFAPSSAFIGLDIDERILELTHPENVSLKVADASDPVALDAALGDTTFDVIIDDGSHRSEHIIRSFQLLFGRLRPGGRYFIEDLHCAYWSAYGGGLTRPTSAIEYLKQLIDVVHADHIEGDEQLTIDATDELLTALRRGLAKVTFYDSLAVIERLPFDKLRPYRRVLAGEHGDLVDPLELLQIEDPGAIHFTEPLARTLEQYLLRQRQAALAANKELEQELEAERSAFSGFREEVESERARVRAHSDELEAQLALADAALANAAVERTKAEHAMLAHFEAQRESAVDALGAALLANRRLERTISAMTSQIEELLEQAKGLEQIPHLRNQIEAIERSLTHRAMVPVRSAAQLTRRGLQRASRLRPARGGASGPRPAPTDDEPTPAPVAIAVDEKTVGRTEIEAAQSLHNSTVYGQWRHQYVNLQLDDRIMIDQQIASGTLPALTVVMRIDTDDGTATSAAIEALRCQRFTDWRAVLVVADGAHLPEARAAAERHVSADARLSSSPPTPHPSAGRIRRCC